MKGESYQNLSAYFSETKARNTTIKALHDVLPLVMYIFYPIQLIALAINEGFGSERLLRFMLIPLGTLIVISIIRALVNAKRPYAESSSRRTTFTRFSFPRTLDGYHHETAPVTYRELLTTTTCSGILT